MAKADHQDKPLSQLFQSEYLRDRFAAAEQDTPPAALAVEAEPIEPTLTPGAVALVEA